MSCECVIRGVIVMQKITYLLGAGASANAIPTVAELPKRLAEFSDNWQNEIRRLEKEQNENVNTENHKDFEILFESVKWLQNEIVHHYSVDTFAKKLLIRGDLPSLKKLKTVLSVFLLFEQARIMPDPRYDVFFSAILNIDWFTPGPILPDNIKIITWNYDLQIEKCYYDFCSGNNVIDKVIDKVINDISFNQKFIIRLNGTAGSEFASSVINKAMQAAFSPLTLEGMGALLDYYFQVIKPNSPGSGIRFAFESELNNLMKNVVNKAIKLVKDTTQLIIIGYSFPFYNKSFDRKILKAMEPTLKKIFIQDMHNAVGIKQLISRMVQSQEISIIETEDRFFIPEDYDLL